VSDSAVGSPRGERRYGRYLVIETLGSGAMGEVLRARDERLGREVALKTVRNVYGMQKAVFRERFDAEAKALAALSHPAVVAVHDVGHHPDANGEDEPYLVMELVDGPSLRARMEKLGPMSAHEVRAMGIQLARGLEAAHARKILHRDIKPANILLAPTGQWKLADFGVAHVEGSDVTMTGQFLGTPAYAAPEALALGQFSDKSDVFGLAVTLVEALTGQRLRGNLTLSEMVRAGDAAIDLPPSVPPDLARALRPALSMDAARRPSAARFAETLAGGGADDGTAVLGPPATAAESPVARRVDTPLPQPALGVAPTEMSLPRAAELSMPQAAAAALPRAATPVGLSSSPGTFPGATQRKRRLGVIAVIVGAVVAVGVIAALMRGGGGGASQRGAAGAARPEAGAPAAEPRADEPTAPAEPEQPEFEPLPVPDDGRIHVRYPQGLDPRAYKEFSRVVDQVREGEFGEALDKLYRFEGKFGATPETQSLRTQLEARVHEEE